MSAFSLSGRQVVLLSSIDWSSAWQRHQILATEMSREGAEVFFVENTGFRDLRLSDLGRVVSRLGRGLKSPPGGRGPRIISPLLLPPTRPLYRALNSTHFLPRLLRLLRRRGLKAHPIVFAYLPTATTLSLLDALSPGLTVYDCVDNFSGHPSPPPDLEKTEAALLSRADLVLNTSSFLRERNALSHPRCIELHHGVPEAFFIGPRRLEAPARRLAYFGTLWSALDYRPINALAEAGFEVHLIGPVKEAPPALDPGVRLDPPVPHEALPAALRDFDALLLPYADNAYNQGVLPSKIYECLATGKPILASPLPSLKPLASHVYFAREPEDFVNLARTLHARETPERAAGRVREARLRATSGQMRLLLEALTQAAHARKRAQDAGPPSATAGALRAFLKGFSWIAASFALARSLTLLAQFVAARLMGPTLYGEAHLVIAVSTLLQIAPTLGFPLAISRFGSVEAHAPKRVLSTALSLFVLWSGACLLLLWALFPLLLPLSKLHLLQWNAALAYAWLSAAYFAAAASLQGLSRFKQRGAMEALYGVASLSLVLLCLLRGVHAWWVLPFGLMGGLALAAAYGLWQMRAYLRPRLDPATCRAMLPFILLGSLGVVASAFIQAPGRIALFHSRSAWEAGIYSVYFTASAQVALALVYMAQAVLIPLASRQEGQRALWEAWRRRAPLAAALALSLFSISIPAALWALGGSYPFDASCLLLFAFSAALIILHGVAAAIFAARDLGGLAISTVGALIAGAGNLAFNALLAPRWGVTGSALALFLGYTLGLLWYWARGSAPALRRRA